MGNILLPDSNTVLSVLLLALVAGFILHPLERRFPAKVCAAVRRKELALDVIYWFLTPLFSRTVSGCVIAFGVFAAAAVFGLQVDMDRLMNGWGIFGAQSYAVQAIEILLLSDFVDYWTHRVLHSPRLWGIHAVHHTPEDMTWISSARVHPLNDLITRTGQVTALLAFGFSARAVLHVVPLVSFYVMFLHSNLRWDFGPFRQLLVSPAYHRWHHTSDEEGIDKNFAGIFPIWDLLFGTQHFPRRLPVRYGLKSGQIPESLWAHLAYPFRYRKWRSEYTQPAPRYHQPSCQTR